MNVVGHQDHIPVLLHESVQMMDPKDGGVYVDGTFGAGGHTKAFLDSADCTVIAIDRDPSALAYAQALKEIYQERLIVVPGCFGDVANILQSLGMVQVDGFMLDIGVSSMQLDQKERGFSFAAEAPLDMRMNPEGDSASASELVNSAAEEELASIIYRYGQERYSRRIAKKIVLHRQQESIETTTQLADIVRSSIPGAHKEKIDPATRTFQALRIAVNDELGQLETALEASQSILVAGGKLVVISFHSLEDGIVKGFLYKNSGKTSGVSRHIPDNPMIDGGEITFSLINKKPVTASNEELKNNPRARSAKLRAATRVQDSHTHLVSEGGV